MTRMLILAMAFLVQGFALGQGQVYINNRIGTQVDARFVFCTDPPGTSSVGSPDYSVSFFGGPVGSTLIPLDPAGTTFRGAAGTAGAGYLVGVTVTVPGVLAGGNAQIMVRVNAPDSIDPIPDVYLSFGPYTVNGLGGGILVPPNLSLGTNPLQLLCIPEPFSITLFVGGFGSLLLLSRFRKSGV